MKNMPFSCAFHVEMPRLLPVKPSLSSYLPTPLRGDVLRKNTMHPGPKCLSRGRTLDAIRNSELNTATIDKGLSFQPLVEKTSAAVLPQKLLELGLTMLGNHVTVNSSLRGSF
jgi:hypothetical protein